MQCVEQSTGNQVLRPNKGSWPYEETTAHPRDTETSELRGDHNQEAEPSPSKGISQR